MRARLVVYRIARTLGLFSLARWLTRHKLRILAYHGFELHDESRFAPSMFMRPDTFAARLDLLRRKYAVLPLGEAVDRLESGTLPSGAVAITIDDGFHSTAAVAAPLFAAAGLPATVYVTSWYVERDVPVFRLAMQYCFWKTRATSLDLAKLCPRVDGVASLATQGEKFDVLWELINYGELHLEEARRSALLESTAAELGVDLDPLLGRRFLHLMTPDEVRATDASIDVQLHTHRHRFPHDLFKIRAEIEDNRRALAPLVARPLVHLCYPSGFWSQSLFPALEAAGIETATTCEGGFNDRGVHRYALRRFFDGEQLGTLEFEAELSGFAELLRTVASWLGHKRQPVHIPDEDRRRGYPAGHGRTILDRASPRKMPA
jgi:peptidoglycan/xylan/chitin deacetylase (PgdA/CDA1 family)